MITSRCVFQACTPAIVLMSRGSPCPSTFTRATQGRIGQVQTSPWLTAHGTKPSTA
jgi:hypothetical protein